MTDPSNLSIAQRLREARELAGLSQAQAARRLNLHRPAISEIEAGRRRVSAQEVAVLADLYGVSVDWITTGESAIDDQRVRLIARELEKLKPADLDKLMSVLRTLKNRS